MKRRAALLMLGLLACRGDQTPGPPPVIDRATVRAAPIDAPPAAVPHAVASDAGAPPTSPVSAASGKRADEPDNARRERQRRLDETKGVRDERTERWLTDQSAAYARALEESADEFADAAPPRSRVDAAVGLRTTP